jgi:hypothetical protein
VARAAVTFAILGASSTWDCQIDCGTPLFTTRRAAVAAWGNEMKKVWLGCVAVALLAVFAWPVPQCREASRTEYTARQDAEEKQRLDSAVEEARKAAEAARGRRAAVLTASDERLRSLYQECRRKVSEQIAAGSKPTFAVYFPDYDAGDLAKLSAMGSAMSTSTGRPSVILNKDDYQAREIAALRLDPSEISVVAESASDSSRA